MATTFRADLVAGIGTCLDAFIAANPTLLRRRFRIRPPSFTTDLPCAYIDLRPETVGFDAGTRTRTFSPSVVVVDALTDNGETYDRLDLLTDALVEHFTDYPQFVAGTIWDRMSVGDEAEETGDGTVLAAVRFTFSNVSMQDGRV